MRKFFIALLSFLLIIGCVSVAVSAEDNGMDVTGSKTADPTELSPGNMETTVTLQLPSGEYKNKIDLVFVLDDSTSSSNANFKFPERATELFDKIVEKNPGIELKVAIIKFKGYAVDMLGTGLTVYDESDKQTFINAFSDTSALQNQHGSNAHSGLVMAKEMLVDDTDVEDSHKYVIFLTDGKNYIWNNENNEPTTYYAQYLRRNTIQNDGRPVLNQYANSYNREQGKSYIDVSAVPDFSDRLLIFATGDNYQNHDPNSDEYYLRLYNSEHEELVSTDTKYDEPAYYTGYYPDYVGTYNLGDGVISSHAISNGSIVPAFCRTFYKYIPDENTFWKDIDYLQINPFEVIENEDGTYSYDTENVNEDFFLWHPDCMMKGTYITGHYWKEEIVDSYNAACIASLAKGSGGGANIVGSFVKWALKVSDFAADVTDSGEIADVFEDIDNSIRYMVNKGTVTDQITDEFELKDVENPFTVEKEKEGVLDVTKLEDNHWGFGTPIEVEGEETTEEVYPYEVLYDPDTKTITWILNVPIENLNKVSLSYPLVLDENAEEGNHETNVSAILDYTTTDGATGTFEFEIPVVTYKKPKPQPEPEPFVFPETGIE